MDKIFNNPFLNNRNCQNKHRRCGIDGGLAAGSGLSGRTKTHHENVSADGSPNAILAQESDEARPEEIYLALFAPRFENHPSQSGMVYRYNLHSDENGIMNLTAIMDVYSRKILGWSISNCPDPL